MSIKNSFTLVGRIGNEPELKEVGDNTVLNLSIAYNDVYKDKDGEKQEKTHWFRVAFWNERAESLVKVLRKGQLVGIDGKLIVKVREKDDRKISEIELIPNHLDIFTPKQKDGAEEGQE